MNYGQQISSVLRQQGVSEGPTTGIGNATKGFSNPLTRRATIHIWTGDFQLPEQRGYMDCLSLYIKLIYAVKLSTGEPTSPRSQYGRHDQKEQEVANLA